MQQLKDITKVSELLEVIDWDFDGHGLTITDGEEVAEAIARRFPELEDDTYTPDDEEE